MTDTYTKPYHLTDDEVHALIVVAEMGIVNLTWAATIAADEEERATMQTTLEQAKGALDAFI